MWPLDVKRMEKVFGPFHEIEGVTPGPELIVTKDITIAQSQKNKNNGIKPEEDDEKKPDILKTNGKNIANNNSFHIINNNSLKSNDDENDNSCAGKDLLSVGDVMGRMFGSKSRARPLPEMIKVVRGWLQEKRQFDPDEQDSLQDSIDCIQKCIDIDSQQVMIDRLSAIARNFKFMSHFRSGHFVIDAQDFTVDIKLESGNSRPDVVTVQHYDAEIIRNERPKTPCPALLEVLRKKQFEEFAHHLEQISYLYNIGADRTSSLKIFTAFDSLERDILLLGTMSRAMINDVNNLIHVSPVGVVEPRQGGTPTKLTFFVRPDELDDKMTGKGNFAGTIETVTKQQLGHHVRVEIEPNDTMVKLQQRPLCDQTLNKGISKKLPEFAFHNAQNSTILHAIFMLKLSTPIVLSQELAHMINTFTNQTVSDHFSDLLNIFISQSSGSPVTSHYSEGANHYVETEHCVQKYRINQYSEYSLQGVLVSQVRFNHPAQISKILSMFRQQLLFNSFLESIFKRPSSPSSSTSSSVSSNFSSLNSHSYSTSLSKMISTEGLGKPTKMIEMTFDDLRSIHLKFSNPLTHEDITLIINLNNQWTHSNLKCQLFPNSLHNTVPEEKVLKVLQKTSSIPETVSYIINQIHECDRKDKIRLLKLMKVESSETTTSSTPTTPVPKNNVNFNNINSSSNMNTTNTMLMNMLQDTGHAGKKRILESQVSTSDSSTSTEGLVKEKKRRRTESCDSKASNSSQENSSISLLLGNSKSNSAQNSPSISSTNLTLASVLASSPSLSAALSSGSSLAGMLSQSGDIVKKQQQQLIKPKNISLLQPNDPAMLKIQASKNAYLKSTSRQNSQEASSPISSGVPDNYAETVLSQLTVFANKPSVNKDGGGSATKKLPDGSQMRRHTMNTVVEKLKMNNLQNSTSGSLLGSKNADDRNAFTIKQSTSSGIKLHITKNKSPPSGSTSNSSASGNSTINNTSGNASGGSANNVNSTGSSGGNNNSNSGESNAAAELFSKIQQSGGFLPFGNKPLGTKLKNYSIPKIPKTQSTAPPMQQQQPQANSLANALTDLEKKPPMQFSQRSSTSQMGPRNNSPMRQNSQPSPQIQRSPHTPQNLFPNKQGIGTGPRFPGGGFNKPAKSINSIANSLFAQKNSAPPGEDSGSIFKGLSLASSQQTTSLTGSPMQLQDSHFSSQSSGGKMDMEASKPLSTPSSPVESPSAMLLEHSLQNAPVIIPVEAIEPKSDLGPSSTSGIGDGTLSGSSL